MSDQAIEAPSLPQANNHMAAELMMLLCKEGANVFYSPFSLSTALAMVYFGTAAGTSQEMRRALGYDAAELADDEILSSYRQLLTAMEKSPEGYILSCANSILRQKSFTVKEEYKSLVGNTFKALMVDADFLTETKEVLNQINSWVSEKTQNMIPQLLDSLDPSTVMVLLNAVYFKGTWLRQFDANLTRKEQFYNNGVLENSKNVDMMHVRDDFLFLENDQLKALQMPYRGEEVAMMIVLPHELDGIRELESNLSGTFFQELKKDMRKMKLDVILPKFRMEHSKSLKSCLQTMGIERIFELGADFDNISNSKQLLVSDVFQKAVLEVNEEGSEAAAATAIMMMCRSAPRTRNFVANHPFMFIIYNTQNDLILFMGKLEEL